METITARIRPAARLISTIGEDLIGDAYAAIVELVKNSYDADASRVDITFTYTTIENKNALKIDIEDDGHGMSLDVILNAWLVPATRDKLDRNTSPRGRLLQGKKGIGRYAAAILGQELVLKSADSEGKLTEVFINWSLFNSNDFLEDVEILVDILPPTNRSGVSLFITATGEKYDQWGKDELGKLTNELRRLKTPFKSHEADDFSINLAFINSPYEGYSDDVFEIEAYPIIELFDYRIYGNITASGLVEATYENRSSDNLPSDIISNQINLSKNESYCGPVSFDIRVFDRDPDAIGNLINKGLIDPINKLAVGKREARAMLNDVYGINLYREGFRVRPYGNGGVDWLNLDHDRIQNPSLRIGNNQAVGFINIKPENVSHLKEKSARDGLKEDSYYFGLVAMLRFVLNELEYRRFNYRQIRTKEKQRRSINSDLENLFDYSSLSKEINQKLKHLKIDDIKINEIASIIFKDAEHKHRLLENIQNTIAIYQGQATLGKIVTVLLHEGRKPVNYFKNQSVNVARWLNHYKSERNWNNDLYDDILDRLNNFKLQGEILSGLFRRLDPLSKQNRGEMTTFNISKAIQKSIDIFSTKLTEEHIAINLECDDDILLNGWEEDLIIVLTNLLENSIYWLSVKENPAKQITIDVLEKDADLIIHYKDNGPGIDKESIEAGSIFEPGFSKKLNGTGLGLPIAGESIERLNGTISAQYSTTGAYFIMEIKKI